VLRHGGEVGGFTATNDIYPDDAMAVVVLTNEDATDVSGTIAEALSNLLFENRSPAEAAALAETKRVYGELREGRIDAARLTANARTYFTPQALADFRASLDPLGKPSDFALKNTQLRGGLTTRVFEVSFPQEKAAIPQKKVTVITRTTRDGLFEQYTVGAK
jgi:D-alanyl-D-alanine carboxypeptidase